jgi:hypothetical protein
VKNCLKKKNDEKENTNQVCEDHKQMSVVALIIPHMIGLSILVQATHDI